MFELSDSAEKAAFRVFGIPQQTIASRKNMIQVIGRLKDSKILR